MDNYSEMPDPSGGEAVNLADEAGAVRSKPVIDLGSERMRREDQEALRIVANVLANVVRPDGPSAEAAVNELLERLDSHPALTRQAIDMVDQPADLGEDETLPEGPAQPG